MNKNTPTEPRNEHNSTAIVFDLAGLILSMLITIRAPAAVIAVIITLVTVIIPTYVAAKLEESHKVLFLLFLIGYPSILLLVCYCYSIHAEALNYSITDTIVDSIDVSYNKFENFSFEYSYY